MYVDPELAAMLDRMAADGLPDLLSGPPEQARERGRLARATYYPPVPFPVRGTENLTVSGIPARRYRPDADGPLPTVVYLHGGGWLIGDLDSHEGHCRRIAATVPAVVLAIDYRLAPEHRFPAAYEDALTAVRWAADHRAELGGSDKLAVAGDSAGGNLAAAVALTGRDEHLPLAAQLLIYPATDLRAHPVANADGGVMTGAGDGPAPHERYLGDPSLADPRASPLGAADHRGLAPAVLGIGGPDLLRPQALAYADALRAAEVPVVLRDYPGLIHGFFGMGSVSRAADRAADELCRDLAKLLS